MEGMEGIRPEVVTALLAVALNVPEFRRDAVYDLEGTLGRYGFALTEEEMRGARDFQARVADLSDEELLEELRAEIPIRR